MRKITSVISPVLGQYEAKQESYSLSNDLLCQCRQRSFHLVCWKTASSA